MRPDHCVDLAKSKWPLSSQSFDKVVDTGGLARYSRHAFFWQELARVLVPGGLFYASMFYHIFNRPIQPDENLFTPVGNQVYKRNLCQ